MTELILVLLVPAGVTTALYLLLHVYELRYLQEVRLELTRIEAALIREIKRRAGETRYEEDKNDSQLEGILEARAGVRSPVLGAPRQPWWRKHGVQAGKGPEEGREVGS